MMLRLRLYCRTNTHHEIGEVSQLETALDAINGRDYGKRVIFDPRKAESEKSMQKLADFNQEIGL